MSRRDGIPPGQGVTRGWPVLHVGAIPRFDPGEPESWRLVVHGAADGRRELTLDDVLRLPRCEVQADFHCVTGWTRLANRWAGVRFSELVARLGLLTPARFVRFSDGVDYDTTVPIEVARAPETLLALAHDGVPLAPEHGGPLRAVVPRLYGWKSCKWLREIELLERERLGFWEARGYHNGADPWREERLV